MIYLASMDILAKQVAMISPCVSWTVTGKNRGSKKMFIATPMHQPVPAMHDTSVSDSSLVCNISVVIVVGVSCLCINDVTLALVLTLHL